MAKPSERAYTLSRVIDSIGTALDAAAPDAITYPLFHSEGTELTDVAFTFLGSDDYESIIEYFLVHPASPNQAERTLASGEFTNIQKDSVVRVPLTAGTLGYLEPVYLRLRPRTQGANLTDLTALLVTFVLQREIPQEDPAPITTIPHAFS